MFRKSSVLLAVLLAVSIPLSGCGLIGQVADKAKDLIPGQGSSPGGSNSAIVPAPPRGITGTVSVGPTVAAATVPVPSSGGKIAVTDTSSPIAGLELNIPVNAYPDTKQFKLSYAPIQTHSFGEAFNPVTPLIRVDNGGAYAQEMMEIKVPVKIPADNFAMGFFYDEKTKKLEGMPTLAIDANSITVGTQHFTDFLISMIPNTKLKTDIDSGFRPGIDDWQFTNNGSYIAQGGHCAGQSLTAMWYYCIQPDGKDLTLFGRYDNNGNKPATPGFDDDDSLGYRFASTVQSDLPATWGTKLMKAQRGVSDELAWKMFAYSIQLTGEPQYVGMTADVGGHAMICYRIYKGNLYIADPNYPGNTERWIDYVKANGTFTPYESGLDAAEIKKGNSIKFTKIGYAAKSAMVDWSTIGRHWAELKNKTIGNDKFPAYTINWIDDKAQSHELKDGYVSSVKQIKIKVDINPAGDVGVKVYCDNVRLTLDAQGNYELKPGNNKLGIDIYGKVGGDYEYIDFKYINVTYGGSNLLSSLQQCTNFSSNVYVAGMETYTGLKSGPISSATSRSSIVGVKGITWSGTSFTGTWKPTTGSETGQTYTVNGTVSADGKTLVSLTASYDQPDLNGEHRKSSHVLNNIPIKWGDNIAAEAGGSLYSEYKSAGLSSYVSKFEYSSIFKTGTTTFESIDWSDKSNGLNFSFSNLR